MSEITALIEKLRVLVRDNVRLRNREDALEVENRLLRGEIERLQRQLERADDRIQEKSRLRK